MRSRGFTLVELIVVMVVVGVIATVGFTRLSDDTGIKARRFGTDAALLLSSAQRLAMAQRRDIFVALSAGGGTVTLCLDSGCTTTIAPAPGQSAALAVPSGIAFTSTATALSFNGRGRPSNSSAVTLRVTTAAGVDLNTVVTVEPETGHVQLVSG